MIKTLSEFLNEDISSIESEILSFFRKDRRAEIRKEKPFSNKSKLLYSIRYWGEWKVPEGEEDDGDYDWEVLTDKSRKELEKFEKVLKSKFKKNKIYISQEEKNYISVDVE